MLAIGVNGFTELQACWPQPPPQAIEIMEDIKAKEYLENQNALTNAATASDVITLAIEAEFRNWHTLVGEARQILIGNFGFNRDETGTLIPPTK